MIDWLLRCFVFLIHWALLVPILIVLVSIRLALRYIYPGESPRFIHLGVWRRSIRRATRPPKVSLRLRK